MPTVYGSALGIRGETESGRVRAIAAFMQRMAERPEVQDALSAKA